METIKSLYETLALAYEQQKADNVVGAERYLTKAKSILSTLTEETKIDISKITPVNGMLCGCKINQEMGAYKVISISKNWPQSHHPVRVGDTVFTDRFMYGKGIGSYSFIKPGDLVAIEHRS